MPSVTIKDNKKKWIELRDSVFKASKGIPATNMQIGLFKEQGSDLVHYAAINELNVFSLNSKINLKKVTGRSFLRRVFDENKNLIIKTMQQNFFSKDGAVAIKKALNLTGDLYLVKLRQKILSNFYKINYPNTDRTIAIKGHDQPLIDTERMITSFTKRFSKKRK